MNPDIETRQKDFSAEMESWATQEQSTARDTVAQAKAAAPGNLASSVNVQKPDRMSFLIGNSGSIARSTAIFAAKSTLAIGAVAGAVYVIGGIGNDGSRSIGTLSNAQVLEAQARKDRAVTIEASPAMRSPGGHTVAELIHAGYVRPGTDPNPQDWSQVKFSGKNGVHDVNGLSAPQVVKDLDDNRMEALVSSIELDLALHGAKLKEQGFSPADYMVVAQMSDLSAAREWLQDGAKPAELTALVGQDMAETLVAKLPSDEAPARAVVMAERRDPLSFLEEARKAARGEAPRTHEDLGREQEKSFDGPGIGFD